MYNYSVLTDEEMIRQLLPEKPNQCFETIYNRYLGKVYRQCLSVIQDSQKAEDLTHDIFLKVFAKLDAFQQRSSFSTWLYTISYNYCVDQIRLDRRLKVVSLEKVLLYDISGSQEAQLLEETLLRVRRAMKTLSDDERMMLTLKYEYGITIDQIADLYQLKTSAVKMRLKRGREKVQRLCA
ncbi:RNA polymerase sigma factor [Spirosoma aerophilum]